MASADSVIGIGQNRFFRLGRVYVSQQPFQSSWPMKPSRGVKAPMPIMMRSPVSREVRGTRFREAAFLISCSRAWPSRSRGFNCALPCGGTSLLMKHLFVGGRGRPADDPTGADPRACPFRGARGAGATLQPFTPAPRSRRAACARAARMSPGTHSGVAVACTWA